MNRLGASARLIVAADTRAMEVLLNMILVVRGFWMVWSGNTFGRDERYATMAYLADSHEWGILFLCLGLGGVIVVLYNVLSGRMYYALLQTIIFVFQGILFGFAAPPTYGLYALAMAHCCVSLRMQVRAQRA